MNFDGHRIEIGNGLTPHAEYRDGLLNMIGLSAGSEYKVLGFKPLPANPKRMGIVIKDDGGTRKIYDTGWFL